MGRIMEIVIFGCGAIGSVLATLIKAFPGGQNHGVHLVGRKHIMEKISAEGLKYVHYNESFTIETVDFTSMRRLMK